MYQEWWLLGYPWQLEKNKDWSAGLRPEEPMIGESDGVVGKKKNWRIGVMASGS
jgi:hypothetical protein